MTMTATLHTTLGDIKVNLFEFQAPKTVANFVGLAEGTKEWTDPNVRAKSTAPLYDGTIFHRVISGFMIQGGDPLGTGTGGPGYRFEDEFHPELSFDRPYLFAMANAGPNTNQSQFFLSFAKLPHLDGKVTIFGRVIDGHGTLDALERLAVDERDRPVRDAKIERVTIHANPLA